MKQCPKCGTTYTDDTLRYCLADGMALNIDEQPTIVRTTPIPVAEKTVALPNDRVFSHRTAETGDPASAILKVVLVVIGLAVLLISALGVAGGLYYYYSAPQPPISATPTPRPTEEPRREQRSDQDDLQKRITELEKQLDERERQTQTSTPPVISQERVTTAVVNSPGDGFLALRSLPNSQAGERILKIPHGATVLIGACGPIVTPVKRSGRWCEASYGGYDGWVFDAYLIYK